MIYINIMKRVTAVLAALIIATACGCGEKTPSGGKTETASQPSGAQVSSIAEEKETNDIESSIISSNTDEERLPPLSYYACVIWLDGKKYTMPCSFTEFENNGWDFSKPSDRERYENKTLKTDESSGVIELKKTDGSGKDSHVGVIFNNAIQGTKEEPVVDTPFKDCVITTLSLGYCHTEGADNVELNLDDGTGLDNELTADELARYYGTPRSTNSGTFTPWWEGASDLTADYVEYNAFYAAFSSDTKNSPYSLFAVWSNKAVE